MYSESPKTVHGDQKLYSQQILPGILASEDGRVKTKNI